MLGLEAQVATIKTPIIGTNYILATPLTWSETRANRSQKAVD